MRHLVARDPSAAFVPPSLASSASATLRCPQCAAPISVPQSTARATGADGAAVGAPGHGGASARTWGGGAGGGGGISGGGWRMAPFMRDSLATLGTAMGGTIASVYAFNAVMPRLGKRIPGSRGLQYLLGVPPVAVAAAAGAGVGAGTLPALIQLCMSAYYVTSASTHAAVSVAEQRVMANASGAAGGAAGGAAAAGASGGAASTREEVGPAC
ncbi:unnamed protein product [Closterium sp. NIES-64]|nr:unnamed protein product [Closterium sp. NIES-64]